MKRIQKIVSGILVFCLVLPMLSMQVLAVEETVADAEVIIDAAYAISEDAEKTVIASDEPERKVASDFTYSYDAKRHKLTISGNGDMPSWEAYEDAPWYSLDYALVEIGEGLTSIGSYAFAYDYAGLGEFTIPYFIIPESVTQIGNNAFFGNAAKLRFRGDAPEFHAAAFDKAVQISVFYPENNETWTTDIQQNYGADMADWNCAYTSGTYACGAKWSYDDSTGVMTLSGEEMPELFHMLPDWNVFFSGTISSVQIEDGVPEIVESAFKDCYALRTISIPDSVTVIGPDAFRKCYNLEELELPESITEMACAFYRCDNLAKIKFTGNAPVFDEYAFVNHTLTAYYPVGNTTWTEEVMQDYGGDITWVPYGEEHVHEYDAIHKCECGAIGGTCGENLTWSFDGSSGTLTIFGTGAMDNFIDITDSGIYYPGKSPWNDYKDQIKHVIIEDGVTTIGHCAFSLSPVLEDVSIPEGITSIGEWAFDDCVNLKTIVLPDSLKTIEQFAFSGAGLTEIFIPDSVTELEGNAFSGCRNLTTVELSENIKEISSHLFSNCGLTQIEIPSSVAVIWRGAFYNCTALTEIVIPENVTKIMEFAFLDCTGLQSITFEGDAPEFYKDDPTDDSQESEIFGNVVATAYYPGGNSTWTADKLQNYGGTITWVPCGGEHVHEFDDEHKCACGAIGGICGKNLTWILDVEGTLTISGTGDMSDYNDYSEKPWKTYQEQIIRVVLRSGVTGIGDNAFSDCNNLTSVTIPEGVISVGYGAFSGCTSLTGITLPEGITSIGTQTFYDCTSLSSITLPKSLTSIGESAFRNCGHLTDITLPERVTNIDSFAFYQCSGLNSITIPEGVTTIGRCTFYACSNLAAITLPDHLTSIEDGAFAYCTSLSAVELPASLTEIGTAAFNSCSSLTNITIPKGVTSINGDTFSGCTSLSDITIQGAPQIRFSAFNESGLRNITFAGDCPKMNSSAFITVIATAYYPANNATWTEEVMQDYGGDITWKPYCPDGHTYDNDQDTTCNDCGFVRELEDTEVVTVPMYRLYNPYTLEHLLTADAAERDLLVGAGWSLDGVAWESSDEGDRVYRLYNPYDDWHTYSMDQAEIDMLVPLGWKIDGAVCHSATKAEGKPVYRLFNPYEQKNYHLLTASEEERENLMELGWTLDGVAWYCLTD